MDSTPIGLILADKDSRIFYVNSQVEKEFGYQKNELIGKELGMLIPEKFRDNHKDLASAFFDKPEKRIMGPGRSLVGLRKDQSEFPIEIGLELLKLEEGDFTLASMLSVAERRALESAQKTLSLINMQLEFLSVISHEIRTPLTSIKEGVSIVFNEEAGPINQEQKTYLELSLRNITRLSNLINSSLDYQKINSKEFSFDFKPNSLNEIAREVVESMNLQVSKIGRKIELREDESVPMVSCDRSRIAQVLFNLLSNAIKFSDQAPIIISIQNMQNLVKVSIQDSGVGIRQSDLDKLFKTFSQINNVNDRKTGGSGLGLAICKTIIDAHHGKIGVSSIYGKGSTFWFSLEVIHE